MTLLLVDADAAAGTDADWRSWEGVQRFDQRRRDGFGSDFSSQHDVEVQSELGEQSGRTVSMDRAMIWGASASATAWYRRDGMGEMEEGRDYPGRRNMR